MTNMKRVFVILLTCIVMFCSLDIRGFAVEFDFNLKTNKGSIFAPAFFSATAKATEENVIKTPIHRDGQSLHTLLRLSIAQDVEPLYQAITAKANTKTKTSLHMFSAFNEGQQDYVDTNMQAEAYSEMYKNTYDLWHIGDMEDDIYAQVPETYTYKDLRIPGYHLFLPRWGAILNQIGAHTLDLESITEVSSNRYLNFTIDTSVYSVDCFALKDTIFDINSCYLKLEQLIRLSWYEALAFFTYDIYTFNVEQDTITELLELPRQFNSVTNEIAVLDAIVHPVLGVVPCIYDRSSDVAQEAKLKGLIKEGEDLYISNLATIVYLFFPTSKEWQGGPYYRTLHRLTYNNQSANGGYYPIRFFEGGIFTIEANKYSPYGDIQDTKINGSEHNTFNTSLTYLEYPFLYYPPDGTTDANDAFAYMTYCAPEFITFWANTKADGFKENMGYSAVSVDANKCVMSTVPFQYKALGTTSYSAAPTALFKHMIPMAYVSEWNDTDMFGIFSYSDTDTEAQINDGLTDLSVTLFADNKMQLYNKSSTYYKDLTEKFTALVEDLEAAGSSAEGHLELIEPLYDAVRKVKPRHLAYMYASDKGKIYECDEAGATAQPDAEGNELEANVVTVETKFDVPCYFNLLDSKIYKGITHEMYTYDAQGLIYMHPPTYFGSSTYGFSGFPATNISAYTAGYFCQFKDTGSTLSAGDYSALYETSILPYDKVNYKESLGVNETSYEGVKKQLLSSYQKHLILIPNTLNECVSDVWSFKKKDATDTDTEGCDEEVYVTFYVETGRKVKYNLTNVNSLDLYTEDKVVTYTNTGDYKARGFFYNISGLLSLSNPTPIKQNVVMLSSPAIELGGAYIEESGLLDWLQTTEASAYINANTETTGYTASTLYKRMISKGVTFKSQVNDDELYALGDITEELANRNQTEVYQTIFNIFGFLGLLVILYGILIVATYFLDLTNTFTETKLLNKVTFGGLTAVHNKEELTEMGIRGAERRHYLTRNGALARWALCTLLGMLLITSKNVFIYVLAFYETVLSLF